MKHLSKTEAYTAYSTYAYHSRYALAFSYKGNEYVISLAHLNTAWMKWETHKGTKALRLRLKAKHKRALIKMVGCMCIGKTEQIYNAVSEYNKGDQFEQMLYEAMTGKEWHKDYTPFYEGADIETAGAKLQVKRDGATICRESTLRRLMEF